MPLAAGLVPMRDPCGHGIIAREAPADRFDGHCIDRLINAHRQPLQAAQ